MAGKTREAKMMAFCQSAPDFVIFVPFGSARIILADLIF
jgi:hypothetical protein